MALLWACALLLCQVGVVVGQSYPSCSTACISAAVPSTCNSTDSVCICQQVDQASLLSCLASSCDCTDQQTAAATFDSNCASNGVQLALDVACAAASSSSASSAQDPAASSVSPSSTSTITTVITSSIYATPATQVTTSVQESESSLDVVTSGPTGLSTSTAVVVWSSIDGTVTTIITSTHWYTTTPLSALPSTSSSSASSSPTESVAGVSQSSLIQHGLTAGAKAAIGAGVGAAVIAGLVVSIWLFWFCRRKRHRDSISGSNHYTPSLGPDFLAGAAVKERSLAGSDRYIPNHAPDGSTGTAMKEKRPSELHSEAASPKPTYSWGTTSPTGSGHNRSRSEEEGFHQSVSAESGQHSPPIDQMAYQRPSLGNDGYWHNAQELPGTAPSPPVAAHAPTHANLYEAPYLQKTRSRPIVPPGKWPPNSNRRTS